MKRQEQLSLLDPQPVQKREVIYVPPSDEVIEKYAYKVCKALAQQDGLPGYDTEFVKGFMDFMKIAATIQAKYLSKGVRYAQKEA